MDSLKSSLKLYHGSELQVGYQQLIAEPPPNAWIKEKIGLRQFRLRGLGKVAREALWACLTYNIQQWIRLVWRPQWLSPAPAL